MNPTLILFAVVVVTIAAGIRLVVETLFWLARRRREQALRPVAASLGLSYSGRVPRKHFPWLGRLTSRIDTRRSRGDHLIEGTYRGTPVLLLEHSYLETTFALTVADSRRRDLRETVACLPGAAHALPDFAVIPADQAEYNLGVDLGQLTTVSNAPESFAREYRLLAKDRAAAMGVLPDAALQFLAARPGWSVQVLAGDIIMTRRAMRCRPEELKAFLVVVIGLAAALTAKPAEASRARPAAAPQAPAADSPASALPAAEARWAGAKRHYLVKSDKWLAPIALVAVVVFGLFAIGKGVYKGITALTGGSRPVASAPEVAAQVAPTATAAATAPAASVAPQPDVSLCNSGETVMFSARVVNSDSVASLCASTGLSADTGYVQYRFGKPGLVALEYPMERNGSQKHFRYERYTRPLVTLVTISFEAEGVGYSIHDDDVNEGPEGAQRTAHVEIHAPRTDTVMTTLHLRAPFVGSLMNLESFLPAKQ